MNKKSIIYLLLWTCLVVTNNSCRISYENTVTVPVNKIILNEYVAKKPIWTIEDVDHKIDRIASVRIRHDSIFGKLSYLGSITHPEKKVFRKKMGENAKSYLHLYTDTPGLSDEIKIPLSDITKVTTHENDVRTTILVSSVIAVAVGTAVSVGFFLVLCNCPYVNVIGTDTTQFQGSLFPGAISKSLERSDNLIMKGIPFNKNGQVNVQISNELPEVEYLDQIELYEAINLRHSSLGINSKGHPVSFNRMDNLLQAITPYNKDITNEVHSYDSGFYDFTEQGNDYELNKVYLTFKKEQLRNNSVLIIRAKQSKWLENVAEFFFQQLGTGFSKWVARIDKVDPNKYNQNSVDSGISMNAYVRRDDHWEYLGSFENVGTLGYRSLALNLDLDKLSGETIEIKLESAHGFWDIDYVGITDEWSDSINLVKLRNTRSLNQDGLDVLPKISADDNVYVELPNEGTFVNMLFEAPSNPDSYLILRGNGYYHHKRNYTAKPNYKVLNELKKDKLSTHQLSRLLQSQFAMTLNKAGNN